VSIGHGPRRNLRSVLLRALGFALLWWVLAEGRALGGPLAFVGVGIATTVSLRLSPPRRHSAVSALGAVRFAGYFVRASLSGGLDVARRALDPRLPLRPGMVSVQLQRAGGASTELLTAALSLMPGTLSVRLDDGRLTLHSLDVDSIGEPAVRELERRLEQLLASPQTVA
jgi:multicomponent Na+:H+ antiporter subunit E